MATIKKSKASTKGRTVKSPRVVATASTLGKGKRVVGKKK